MGYKDKALYYYKKGQDNLNQKENKVYEAKINNIYEFLQKNPSKIIDRCRSHIHCLIEKNDLDSVHDLALLISDYFSEQEYY
ncbi:hypothetical protein [Bacillus atrophaeus]|uniref:hypothetical protein n=1 Tax=Bacillus atrophaeus TaxID=1452 RepID=UPI0007C4C1C2|nr:hypothetical protein [Bacillus atrophaeus]MBU5265000.1 hypothetical protein [Bacillus atrophaeus]MDS9995199.1 hypothetical protein [Bacillus atrophaeus]PRS09678.1 hypothetical protein C6W22_02315 [Bacillus atrophaeus]QUF67201.1 hypothetical protein KCX77_09945 [Bacillus atrophaeus]WFE15923.1 hypothetical protein P4829_09780 [Bacillus atrophaeus]